MFRAGQLSFNRLNLQLISDCSWLSFGEHPRCLEKKVSAFCVKSDLTLVLIRYDSDEIEKIGFRA